MICNICVCVLCLNRKIRMYKARLVEVTFSNQQVSVIEQIPTFIILILQRERQKGGINYHSLSILTAISRYAFLRTRPQNDTKQNQTHTVFHSYACQAFISIHCLQLNLNPSPNRFSPNSNHNTYQIPYEEVRNHILLHAVFGVSMTATLLKAGSQGMQHVSVCVHFLIISSSLCRVAESHSARKTQRELTAQ